MTYTPNIPQADDDPTESQGQILSNFQVLNNVYGTIGDHFPWTDTNANEIGKHAKVTMPALPVATTNLPGNVVPTPTPGSMVIFAQLYSSTYTQPYLRNETGSGATSIPMMPIKAFASYNSSQVAFGTPYNITSISRVSEGLYNLALAANIVSGLNVAIQATVQDTTRNWATAQATSFDSGTKVLTIQVRTTGTGGTIDNGFSVMVLENA